ncbi:MAG: hypothetical protein JRN20_20220 [Nitrososphaerota archaeon]|nr:hypothetical protein [Nitrososphaerota archaeon]
MQKKTNQIGLKPNNLNAYVGKSGTDVREESAMEERKMILYCRTCGKAFDSTFAVNDFAALSSEQLRAGTIHLCPHCGELAIYQLSDYKEPKS